MRKWVVIGLLVLGTAGVMTSLATRPKRGSVEWHKKEYRRAWYQASRQSFRERVEDFYDKLRGARLHRMRGDAIERFESNKAALVQQGFLLERKYPLTKSSSLDVMLILWTNSEIQKLRDSEFTWIESPSGVRVEEIWVTAPREVLPRVEALIRKADVPAAKSE